ncbi:hypothetical protein F1728_04275 [Gimesia benthica]|uniref:Type I restriction modification DNA specificity domain-containing protein n=1 Tax=Gimesia benthica TaxID=2608982 RepID=A0A6I6A761_9PLAN|nr:hypothetical protein [Gimesia benthica]QGQ21953.1 hypothetical protein F1728_04275 [Gimesia benthica]
MKDRKQSGHFHYPTRLAQMIADIARLYQPSTAIDPNCDDLTVLNHCDFLAAKRAIFRNPNSLDQAEATGTDIDLGIGDFWREPLDELFDLVITTTLPFGARIEIGGRIKKLDEIIANRCLDIVAPNGICILIVPSHYLYLSVYNSLRERILDYMSLDASIEITPSTLRDSLEISIPLTLLVIRNGPQKSQGTFLAKYESGSESEIVSSIESGTGDFFVQSDKLRDRWDRSFHDPAYQKLENKLKGFETKALRDIAQIRRGKPTTRDQYSDFGEILIVSPRHVHSGDLTVTDRDRCVSNVDDSELLQPGDVLVSLSRPSVCVYQPDSPPAIAGMQVAVIRSLQGNYIATFLRSEMGSSIFQQQMDRHSKGTTIESISPSDLIKIQIPILPLEDLNSISDEAISEADSSELEALKTELLRVRHMLETSEARRESAESQLEEEKTTNRENNAHHQLVESQLGKILEQQTVLNSQIDQVLKILTGMREQIDSIKQGSRKDEEKLSLICTQLEEWTKQSVSQKRNFAGYVRIVQSWLDEWDILDQLTQQFLPSAEHLYDELERLKASDFSPFIVQYCRSLENEILTKLFVTYHEDFNKRISNKECFLKSDLIDLESGDLHPKTGKFAKALKNDQQKYTLGDMKWVMGLMKSGGKTLASSPLLQDFKAFSLKYFDERITQKDFLKMLTEITDDYRNKSAHPYLMGKSEADKCLQLVRRSLTDFLESYQSDSNPLSDKDK